MGIRVASISPISNHSLVKAVVELDVDGLRLRGLKLEQTASEWRLSPPGRKVSGRWQVLFDFTDGPTYQRLLREVLHHGKFPDFKRTSESRIFASAAAAWEECLDA